MRVGQMMAPNEWKVLLCYKTSKPFMQLSRGQSDQQVVASGRELNLRRDLIGWPNRVIINYLITG